MQIWEAETLHMSQLAGGWDFLTLSGWRCASKKKKNCITNNRAVVGRLRAAAGAGGAASPGWAGRDRRTKGQKELWKPPQEQQDLPRWLQNSGPPVPPPSARWIARSGGTASMAY